VAGIVRSRYQKDFGWGELWRRYDPAARAAFYVRVLCGLFADGLEDPASFACKSQAERGACPGPGCGWELGSLLPGVVGSGRPARTWSREEKP
jgi:hypothetical protein